MQKVINKKFYNTNNSSLFAELFLTDKITKKYYRKNNGELYIVYKNEIIVDDYFIKVADYLIYDYNNNKNKLKIYNEFRMNEVLTNYQF
jgi:hypothetical protein